MSHNDNIRLLLNIKDTNITFNEENWIQERNIKGINVKVFTGTLTYKPKACPKCGCVNDHSIVKDGFMTSRITWLRQSNTPTYLELKKQRFWCHECDERFIAHTSEVARNCHIAKQVKQSVLVEAADTISNKDLARRHCISDNTSRRIINRFMDDYFRRNRTKLAKHMCFDEIKSTKQADNQMSFIFSNEETHEVLGILPTRQLYKLREYFRQFSLKERSAVETIVVDMNAPYMTLVREMFPNAKVIIDRFHIIQLISRSLNKTRVQVMNTFNTNRNHGEDKKEYRKLKSFWKLILKDFNEVDFINYRKQRLFKGKMVCDMDILDHLLSLDEDLTENYWVYQALLEASKENNIEMFHETITAERHQNISKYMQTSLNTLLKNIAFIANTFHYKTRSNASLEGKNNRIKVIKRVSYGYRNFFNFRNRVMISFILKPGKPASLN